jgi:hypothetical protein
MYGALSLGLASILGGPIASAYLASKNLENIGKEGAGTRLVLATVAFTVVEIILFLFVLSLPGFVVLLALLVQSLCIGWVSNHYFSGALDAHLESGGVMFSSVRALLISLLFFLMMLALTLVLIWFAPGLFYLVLSVFS